MFVTCNHTLYDKENEQYSSAHRSVKYFSTCVGIPIHHILSIGILDNFEIVLRRPQFSGRCHELMTTHLGNTTKTKDGYNHQRRRLMALPAPCFHNMLVNMGHIDMYNMGSIHIKRERGLH